MFPHLSSGARPNREGFDVNYSSKPQPALPASERTQYGYKNVEGHRLHIMADRILTGHVLVSITGVGDLEPRSLNIPDVDVPGVALALLKSAGFGQIHEHLPHHDDIPSMVELAAGHLSDAVATREQVAAEKLTRRRNELAKAVAKKSDWSRPDAARFADLQTDAQTAIDMIIQLQDEATK